MYVDWNHLGNVRVVIGQNKTNTGNADVVYYSDYYPYGSPMTLANNDYRYGYQGQYAEADKETGWNNFQLRMYDPLIGRWMSTDPYGQHASPYLSMGNNPVMRVDPNGGRDEYDNDGNGNIIYKSDKGGTATDYVNMKDGTVRVFENQFIDGVKYRLYQGTYQAQNSIPWYQVDFLGLRQWQQKDVSVSGGWTGSATNGYPYDPDRRFMSDNVGNKFDLGNVTSFFSYAGQLNTNKETNLTKKVWGGSKDALDVFEQTQDETKIMPTLALDTLKYVDPILKDTVSEAVAVHRMKKR